jgi:20S proteasome alpha/beta subunit
MSGAFESHARPGEVATGTTIMAVAFDGGVVSFIFSKFHSSQIIYFEAKILN